MRSPSSDTAGAQSESTESSSPTRVGGCHGSAAVARRDVQMSRPPARFDMKKSSSRSPVNVGSSSIASGSDSAATSTGGVKRGGRGGAASAPASEMMVPSSSLRTQPNGANGQGSAAASTASLTATATFRHR